MCTQLINRLTLRLSVYRPLYWVPKWGKTRKRMRKRKAHREFSELQGKLSQTSLILVCLANVSFSQLHGYNHSHKVKHKEHMKPFHFVMLVEMLKIMCYIRRVGIYLNQTIHIYCENYPLNPYDSQEFLINDLTSFVACLGSMKWVWRICTLSDACVPR